MLTNPGFETPGDTTNYTDSGWTSFGTTTRRIWYPRGGSIGGVIVFGVWLQANHHIIAATHALHLCVVDAGLAQAVTHIFHMDRLGEMGAHHGAAGELQRVVEALEADDSDGCHQQHQHQAPQIAP